MQEPYGEGLATHTGPESCVHDFDLGLPADYVPPTQNVNVVTTSAANPLPVVFAPIMADVNQAVVAVVSLPGGRRKAKSAEKKKKKAAKGARPLERMPGARWPKRRLQEGCGPERRNADNLAAERPPCVRLGADDRLQLIVRTGSASGGAS